MSKSRSMLAGFHRIAAFRVLAFVAGSAFAGLVAAQDHTAWVGSWATAVSVPAIFDAPVADPPFSDQTLRQIVRISVGGDRLRVWLTNVHGTAPLRIDAAAVALRAADASIVAGSSRALSFGGVPGVTISAGARVLSDPVDLAVTDLADLALSIYVPGGGAVAGSPVSFHVRGLQTSYVLSGDQTEVVDPLWDATIDSTFWISGVDVLSARNVPVLAAFGDSITDGDQSTADANNRWPNLLAARLLQGNGRDGQRGGRRAGVLNVGISGNQVTATLLGESALARFDRDVLTRTGVTHVLVLEGINDIGLPAFLNILNIPAPPITPEQIIAGYQQLIAQAHAHGLRIIGGTLTPSGGYFLPDYNTATGEAKRQAVNDWIRSSGAFDAVVDFDAVLRDPNDPTHMRADLTADGLHPNDAGYQVMANAVRNSIFAPEPEL